MKTQIFKISHKDIVNHSFNLGLYYYKYLPLSKKEQNEIFKNGRPSGLANDGVEKADVLRGVVRLSQKLEKKILHRRLDVLKNLPEIQTIKMATTSRLLCGVGYQHRMEWGLNLDWTTGYPYIPGSSWKGAMLSYLEFLAGKPVEKWANNDQVKLETGKVFNKYQIIDIFGPQGNAITKPSQGQVMFLDAYPEPESFPGLELDIITPHYMPYYTSEGENPPADIYNPVPQPFLTVPEKTVFLFQFVSLTKNASKYIIDLKTLIQETGQNHGFGAKTATGYGYLNPV